MRRCHQRNACRRTATFQVSQPTRIAGDSQHAAQRWQSPPRMYGARRVARAEVEAQFLALTGRATTPDDWRVQSKRQIVQRLVQNLVSIAEDSNDAEAMLRYIDGLLTLDPASLHEHWRRALLCYQTGRQAEALSEVKLAQALNTPHFKPDKVISVVNDAHLIGFRITHTYKNRGRCWHQDRV